MRRARGLHPRGSRQEALRRGTTAAATAARPAAPARGLPLPSAAPRPLPAARRRSVTEAGTGLRKDGGAARAGDAWRAGGSRHPRSYSPTPQHPQQKEAEA